MASAKGEELQDLPFFANHDIEKMNTVIEDKD